MSADSRVSVLALGLFWTVLGVYIPTVMFADSREILDFAHWTFLIVVVPPLLLLWGISSLLVLFLPSRWQRHAAPVLVFFAVAVLVNGAIVSPLTTNIGALNGTEKHFAINWLIAGAELGIDAIVLAAIFVVYRRYYGATLNLLVAVIAVMWIYVGSVDISSIFLATPQEEEDTAKLRDLMRFSSTENIVVFILDEFQSDFLVELLNQNPGIYEKLDGFTLFADTSSVSPTTYFAMPSIHTGIYPNPERSLRKVYEEDIGHKSFLTEMVENGAQAYHLNPALLCPARVTCVRSKALLPTDIRSTLQDQLLLVDISLFRAAPHLAKAAVLNRGNWLLSSLLGVGPATHLPQAYHELSVLNELANNISVSGSMPQVKFIHSFATHNPYILDESCHPAEDVKPSWERAVTQAGCAIRAVSAVLEALKNQGIYDKTLIVLASDHGAGEIPAEDSASIQIGGDGKLTASILDNDVSWYPRANALFAVKPANSRGRLQIDREHAVSLIDLPKTICNRTTLCAKDQGEDAFSAPPAAERLRKYLFYVWQHEYWGLSDFRSIVEERTIDKPATTREFETYTADVLRLNRDMLGLVGFSRPEQQGRWTDGAEAEIVLKAQNTPKKAMVLRVKIKPFLRESHNLQTVRVWTGGEQVADWKFRYPGDTKPRWITIPLKKSDFEADGRIRVKFELPDANSVFRLDGKGDKRALGLFLYGMQVELDHSKSPGPQTAK